MPDETADHKGDDDDDDDDDDDPMSSSDAWSDFIALSGGETPWRKMGAGGRAVKAYGNKAEPLEREQSWPSRPDNASPSRSGSPMLTMAAMGVDKSEHAKGTPQKPKLVTAVTSGSGGMDIYSPPAAAGTSAVTAIPSPTGLNEKCGMKVVTEPERFVLSPQSAFSTIATPEMISPPGIPMTWTSPKVPLDASTPIPAEPAAEPLEEFLVEMRAMFKDMKKKSTAQTPTVMSKNNEEAIEIANSLKEEFKEVSMSVKQLIERYECKPEPVLEKATQTPETNKPTIVQEVVIPKELHGFLNTAETKQLGKIQRQIAREFIAANSDDKQLDIWSKASEYEDLPGLSEDTLEEKCAAMSAEVMQSSSTPAIAVPEVTANSESDSDVSDGDSNTFGKLIIDRIWEKFKNLNATCQEEIGSAFYKRWKSKVVSSNQLLKHLGECGIEVKEVGVDPSTGKTILEKIDGPWPSIEELKNTFEGIEGEFENDGLNVLSPFGSIAVDDIKGVVKQGKWLRIRNGMTMDSGSSVFVMPSDWLEMFELRESTGSKKGQTYVAAAKDGKPIVHEGEKTINIYAKPSLKAQKRKLIFQVAKVNKMLASVEGFCDADNEVIFRKYIGCIRSLIDGEITQFRRHGNIYLMDAYIPNPDYQQDMEVDSPFEDSSFPRPEGR